jgi:N-acetylglucosaminyldiphosphoundecaprenol N-acetyl-beta-D-mannosaminyltransferase
VPGLGKCNLLGVMVDATDYERAIEFIVECAREKRSAIISALAVHGVMTGALDAEHKFRLNSFDLLVPDGQPVRWALNLLYGAELRERVYGPELTRRLCERAAREGMPIYLYGSAPGVLTALVEALKKSFPEIRIAGSEPSAFRSLTREERAALAARIRASGAGIVFAGLGCPRQEIFAYEMCGMVSVPILAVGAAFPFLAGKLPQAPPWMQRRGLEWLFRLAKEPRRLWRRYLYLNPAYLFLIGLQWLSLRRYSPHGDPPRKEVLVG